MSKHKLLKSSLYLVVMAAFIFGASSYGTFLFHNNVANAAGSGAIWTTESACGTEAQDLNHYNIGEIVYINGDNFDPNTSYDWEIKGQPGNSSADPNIIVASGSEITDSNGEFCINAYTVQNDDDGEYKVKFGNAKQDNYRVDGDSGLDYSVIAGFKFNDLNMDGIWNGNEPPLNDWEICNDLVVVTTDDRNTCVLTGSGQWPDGYYEFLISGTRGGTLTITETQQAGWTQSAPSTGTHEIDLNIQPTRYANNDFGNYLIPFCGDGVVNQESEQCDGTDGITGNQTCSQQCTIIEPEPEILDPVLSILKSVDKALVNPDDTLVYTVVVSNSGDGDAINAVVNDTLPAGLTFMDADGNNTGETTMSWNLGDLLAGDDIALTYNVHVDSSAVANDYENIAVVHADNFGKVSANAITEIRIPVVLGEETPSLTIDKSVAESFVNPGGTVAYTINVSNDSTATAYNAVLDDVLPAGFTYVDNGKTTMQWDLGDVVPGETVTINYTVNVGIDVIAGTYVNVATTSADDVNAITDDASVEVREIEVLGAEDELPVTGMGFAQLLIVGAMGLLAVGGRYMRKGK